MLFSTVQCPICGKVLAPHEKHKCGSFTTLCIYCGKEHAVGPCPQIQSVCLEAEAIVSTDRNKQYGSPLENLTRTANLLNDMGFAYKGKPLIAADAGLILLIIKVARLAHGYKRDTLVDTCGYARCISEVVPSEAGQEPRRLHGDYCTNCGERSHTTSERQLSMGRTQLCDDCYNKLK